MLRVLEESERVIPAVTPLLELNNLSRLEVVVEQLSTDAVKIRPPAKALVEFWGGDAAIPAPVRLVEPQG